MRIAALYVGGRSRPSGTGSRAGTPALRIPSRIPSRLGTPVDESTSFGLSNTFRFSSRLSSSESRDLETRFYVLDRIRASGQTTLGSYTRIGPPETASRYCTCEFCRQILRLRLFARGARLHLRSACGASREPLRPLSRGHVGQRARHRVHELSRRGVVLSPKRSQRSAHFECALFLLTKNTRYVQVSGASTTRTSATANVPTVAICNSRWVFESGCRLSVRGSRVRWRVFWRATGHVLECVETLQSPKNRT